MGVLEDAERAWRGDLDVADAHPLMGGGELVEVAPGVAFLHSFANVTALATDAGLALVDTGNPATARFVHERVRSWTAQPLRTAVYSHGHIDHVFGVGPFEEEASANGWDPPRVVAHENVPLRFDRYRVTAGYNEVVNRRQFRAPGLDWPTEYRYPDETYATSSRISLGDATLDLTHAKGETDDATWAWVPERRVLCTGDLFIWCTPNAGNPQKVQRYPVEWRDALREMAALGAEVLLPGHGWPILGADRIREALENTADLLHSLCLQTIALMNEGARLDRALQEVTVPERLAALPYLQPVYDEPEFIVRTIWRRFGGWFDGNPATLKPAPESALAAEVASLAGGAAALAERAVALTEAGEHRLAGHLAEWAFQTAPDDPAVRRAHSEVFERRAEAERSTMARGIFTWAAEESRQGE